MTFKPWGELKWLLSKLPNKKFALLGCLSTEIRCGGAYSELASLSRVAFSKFIEIKDPSNSSIHDDLRDQSTLYLASILKPNTIEKHSLLEPTEEIIDSCKSLIAKSNGQVVLDVTAFPKRFFFPLLKLLYKSDQINDFIITYTVPERYAEGNLSDNAQSWASIPLFSPTDVNESDVNLAIIGIGFMPLGLPNFLKDKHDRLDIKFLFPFPPGPPHYQRTWDFVNQIDASTTIDTKQIYRIDTKSVPSIFDKIKSLAHNKNVIFAPYGPKTISLAMCLYAAINNSPVYYTQPTSYNPNYSYGCGKTYAYLIKFNGISLYE